MDSPASAARAPRQTVDHGPLIDPAELVRDVSAVSVVAGNNRDAVHRSQLDH